MTAKKHRIGFVTSFVFAIFAVVVSATTAQADPPFDSTADTTFDIIAESDPTQFMCLIDKDRGERQIWDKRVDGEPVVNAYLFQANYRDGTTIEIAINPEYDSLADARDEAMRFAVPLGQLPTLLREGIGRFSVHKGDKGFHAGTGQVVVYADRATQRQSYVHLEESLFHEAVHASLDDDHRLAPNWVLAQKADDAFLTTYAASRPEREDLAETALFAFAILRHPERLPPADTEVTLATVPNRVDYIRNFIFKPGAPMTYNVAEPRSCPE
jgi:hypothetical protein